MTYKQVIIQKPDLDTCLTGLICGVNGDDNIVVLNHEADESDLYNPSILCIEAGGSGQVYLNNFDHHDVSKYYPSACRQAYGKLGLNDTNLFRLVDYVSMVDERVTFENDIEFPSLSNIFSGMLLIEGDPKRQFIKGIEILKTVLQRGIDPFGTMPDLIEWESYRNAKVENTRRLQEALKDIMIYKSKGGVNIGFLQTDAIGGIEAIYNQDCEIAVLYNTNFGNPPIKKYTVASKGLSIGHLINILNVIEQGWGGRATIIGSPRTGTSIKPEDLINLLNGKDTQHIRHKDN